MEFNNRLQTLIDNYYRGNKKSLAEAANVPYTTLIDYTNGNRKDPTVSFVWSIYQATPQISLLWLTHGIGDMLNKNGEFAVLVNESLESYWQSQADRTIKCLTDELRPYICIGDMVKCKHTDKNFYGRPYIIIIEGQQMIGHLHPAGDGKILLKHLSENYPDYEVEESTISEKYLILGTAGARS